MFSNRSKMVGEIDSLSRISFTIFCALNKKSLVQHGLYNSESSILLLEAIQKKFSLKKVYISLKSVGGVLLQFRFKYSIVM